jgi:hypothetical protein
MNTSFSDKDSYTSLCEEAATSDTTFEVFKSIPNYREILEHVTYEEGLEYADLALANPLIAANIDKFQCNDTLGKPQQYTYNFGRFSPTTLRYVKTLSDLSQLKLEGSTIVEIGCGYGGQYTVIRQLFKPKKYIFVDLLSTLKLIKKYIGKQGLLSDIELQFMDPSQIIPVGADLCISNYAFSECTHSLQDEYIEKILNNCVHGYMVYNDVMGYTHQEFLNKFQKKAKQFPERPQTHPKNVLITW